MNRHSSIVAKAAGILFLLLALFVPVNMFTRPVEAAPAFDVGDPHCPIYNPDGTVSFWGDCGPPASPDSSNLGSPVYRDRSYCEQLLNNFAGDYVMFQASKDQVRWARYDLHLAEMNYREAVSDYNMLVSLNAPAWAIESARMVMADANSDVGVQGVRLGVARTQQTIAKSRAVSSLALYREKCDATYPEPDWTEEP